MADAILEARIGALETDSVEIKRSLEENHDRLDNHSDGIDRLIRWALDGNGESAESRLVCIEKQTAAIPEIQAQIAAVQMVANAQLSEVIGKSVKEEMDARDKTAVAKVKAWSPIIVSGIALVTIVVQIILGKVL